MSRTSKNFGFGCVAENRSMNSVTTLFCASEAGQLAGQDVASPGVAGAFMGGLMAAAAIEPALLRQLAG
jgi:hypothetical protein